jgi:HAD superfamily hydrolase (TIGR01509 family)
VTIEALVFDFDGLILDTETPEYETVAAEFAAHGVDLPLAAWQQIVGGADHPHWLDWLEDELGRPLPDRQVVLERRRAAHHRRIAAEVVLDGVIELLDEAVARDVPVAVASSSPSTWVDGHLQRLALDHHFAVVRCRDHVARAKPWPDLYLAAVEAVGARPGRSVALEDSHNGSRAAKAAGLACIVVPNAITATQDFAHADLVLPSLAELRWDVLTRLVAGTTPTSV